MRIPRSGLKLAGNIEHSGKHFLIYIIKKGTRKDVVCSEDDTVKKKKHRIIDWLRLEGASKYIQFQS